MIRFKFIAVLFSFILVTPVLVAGIVLIQDNMDDLSDQTNCFNIQEEEEDSEESEEEVDDNESKKLMTIDINYRESSDWNCKNYFSNIFLKNTVYLPGVPSPPPELS